MNFKTKWILGIIVAGYLASIPLFFAYEYHFPLFPLPIALWHWYFHKYKLKYGFVAIYISLLTSLLIVPILDFISPKASMPLIIIFLSIVPVVIPGLLTLLAISVLLYKQTKLIIWRKLIPSKKKSLAILLSGLAFTTSLYVMFIGLLLGFASDFSNNLPLISLYALYVSPFTFPFFPSVAYALITYPMVKHLRELGTQNDEVAG